MHWLSSPEAWSSCAAEASRFPGQTRSAARVAPRRWLLAAPRRSTHPPKAFIDSTAQTIVTSAPSAGQVQVPLSQTPDFQFETIVTPALSTGNFLQFFYWPELLIKFVGEATNIAVTNGWFFNVSIIDFPAGDYALP